MEPLNKGHIGTRSFVLYRDVSFIRRLKCIGIIGIEKSRFVLYREMFLIRSVLYRSFHYIPASTCISCHLGASAMGVLLRDIKLQLMVQHIPCDYILLAAQAMTIPSQKISQVCIL